MPNCGGYTSTARGSKCHGRDGVKKLVIWCLSDGRPGHFNQSRGIIKALSRNFRVEPEWIEVRLRYPFVRLVLTALFNYTRGAWFNLVRMLYSAVLPDGRPDLVVSSGGNTLFLNVSLARHFGCRNLFSGGLRKLAPRCFTAYLTLEDDPHENAVPVVLAPTEMDIGELAELRTRLRSERQWQGPVWMMAIGGNSGIYHYHQQDWQALAAFMHGLSGQAQVRWLLTTSRRTGREVEEKLQAMIDPGILLDAVWYASAPGKVMREFLALADVVVCTEDSFSMITESVSGGRPVIAARPEQVRHDAHYAWAVNNLVQAGLIVRVPLQNAVTADVVEGLAGIRPLQQSMPDRLAEQLARFL